MIYLDSSALLKLVHEEPESSALEEWLSSRESLPLVSSELSKAEVMRASRRVIAESVAEAAALIASLDLIPISSEIIDRAVSIGHTTLRSLDAIHLASAQAIRDDLTFFAVYDNRLADAALAAGLPMSQPGR